MAAVIVTTAPARRSLDRATPRPPLQVLPGGRRAVRSQNRARRSAGSVVTPAVYRRRRLGALLVAVSLVAVAYLAVVGVRAAGGQVAPRPSAPVAATGHVYVVQPGDTLWSIARSLHPHGDIRPVVDRLERRLGTATLQPGQRVSVDGLAN
jgi:nucleoid-associated protein YgaU